jgi:hypothetical protein
MLGTSVTIGGTIIPAIEQTYIIFISLPGLLAITYAAKDDTIIRSITEQNVIIMLFIYIDIISDSVNAVIKLSKVIFWGIARGDTSTSSKGLTELIIAI